MNVDSNLIFVMIFIGTISVATMVGVALIIRPAIQKGFVMIANEISSLTAAVESIDKSFESLEEILKGDAHKFGGEKGTGIRMQKTDV